MGHLHIMECNSPYKSRVHVASNALLFLVLKMHTHDLQ